MALGEDGCWVAAALQARRRQAPVAVAVRRWAARYAVSTLRVTFSVLRAPPFGTGRHSVLLPTAADPFFAEAVVVLAAGSARDESVWEVVLTQRRDGVGGSRGVDGHYELRTDV